MARGGSSYARRHGGGVSAAAFGATFSNPVRDAATSPKTQPVSASVVLAPHERVLSLPPPPRFPRAARLPVVFVLVAVPVSACTPLPAGILDVEGELVSDVRAA